MHINQEDDPIAGEKTDFFFEFKDKEGKFNPQNCECTFTILEKNKQLYSQPMFQNEKNANIFFTFPKKDVYLVKVIGKPLKENSFKAFTLMYDIRVDREQTASQTIQNTNWILSHAGHLLAGIAFIIFVLFLYMKQRIDKRDEQK